MAVFDVEVGLRWADLDAQAHVNNALVVDYLQEARVAVLLGSPLAGLLGNGIVVVAQRVEYLAPISYSSRPLQVRLRVCRVRAASFSYSYELTQDGVPVARAETDLCLLDVPAQRPRRLTGDERAWFDGVQEEVEPLRPLEVGPPAPVAHSYDFRVRYSDVDSNGHVNNVRFFTYTGEARVALQHELGLEGVPTAPDAPASGSLLIARQDLRYLQQLQHRLAPYVVRTSLARVGRTSVTFIHEIVDPLDERTLARSIAVLVHADAAGRPVPVPPSFRAAAGAPLG